MAESSPVPALSRSWLPVGVGLAAYGTALTRGSAFLADPDVYQHVAVGRWIVSHGSVPHTDVFSYTMYGAPWVPHEWLSEVIFYALYDRFGWLGLFVVVAAAFALAMALLLRALLTFLAPTYAVIGTMTAWGLCFPTLVARPHVLAFPLMVAWIAALVAARNRNRAPSPWTALLMVLWANLHGSFMLGLAFAALFGGEALFEARDRYTARRAILGWGGFGLLSLAAALATPNGIAGVLLPLDMMRMNFALSFVSEWQSPDFQHPQPLEMWLMLLLLGTLIAGIRLPVTRIVLLIVLLHMALSHVRYAAVLGMLTPLLIAPFLSSQLPRGPQNFMSGLIQRSFRRLTMPAAGMAAFAVALVVLIEATSWYRGGIRVADRFTPVAALAAVRANQITGPVFNDFNFGGFLVLSGVPVFIDARVDMYGDRFLLRYAKRDELVGILSQYQIAWTILGADHPDVLLLDHLPGWRRLYADRVAVVHVRDATAPQ